MQINASTEAFEERRQRAFRINLADILQHVGPGQYQFIGVVSKAWHALVHSVPSVNRKRRYSNDKYFRSTIDTVTVLSRMTTYDAVFASTSRCHWALDTGLELGPKSATRGAGMYASIDTLTMIAEKLIPQTLIETIIIDRSIEVLQWALNHFDLGDGDTMMMRQHWATAAATGNLHTLQLLATKHTLSASPGLIAGLASISQWHVVEYLRAQVSGVEWRDVHKMWSWLHSEARDERLDIDQFLLEHLRTQDEAEMCVGIPQWELEQLAQDEVEAVYRGSVRSGNIYKVRSLQRLFDDHCELTVNEFEEAVKGGHLDMCIYLVDNSSSDIIDNSSLLTAAELGHTHILKWGVNLVREQRSVEVRSLLLRVACSTGCVDTLQFLYPHLPAEGNTAGFTHCLNHAAIRGFWEAAKWFKEKGGSWPSTLGGESANWPQQLVEWARRENCTAPLHIT
jgi:hypothetical protein